MARFSGKIGFGIPSEVAPGVYDDTIVERRVKGDIIWSNRRYMPEVNINQEVVFNAGVSAIADSFLNENFQSARYVEYNGQRWTISSIEMDPPRIRFYFGSVYNGPTPN